jgi:toxin-antitoxin system PIN domain toxin
MLMPDLSVLVYAHRADEARHADYRRWLQELVGGPQPFALSALVAADFVRVVTDSRLYSVPTPLPTALATIEQLASHPHAHLAVPGSDHLRVMATLCRATGTTGKRVAQAQHAALAISEGCTWVTADGDFARFLPHGLRWEHLLP